MGRTITKNNSKHTKSISKSMHRNRKLYHKDNSTRVQPYLMTSKRKKPTTIWFNSFFRRKQNQF